MKNLKKKLLVAGAVLSLFIPGAICSELVEKDAAYSDPATYGIFPTVSPDEKQRAYDQWRDQNEPGWRERDDAIRQQTQGQ